ncbi:MAG: hypothetical protein HDS64_00835 [Bacteroidales bacterium]|nr:hypothetical protein [Bacteroidales bacterium]
MRIWKWIGDFFLFRWVVGEYDRMEKHESDHKNDAPHGFSYDFRSYDDFHEEQDDYDMFDDF